MTDFAALLRPDDGAPAHTVAIVDDLAAWLAGETGAVRALATLHRFEGKPGSLLLIPGTDWRAAYAPGEAGPWRLARLAEQLPPGTYRLAGATPGEDDAFGWLLAQHRFTRYRRDAAADAPRVLLVPQAVIAPSLALAEAVATVRDLVDTPASDMGPADLEAAARALADRHGGAVTVTDGDALASGYPMIHAVGLAAAPDRQPRLIELEWGDPAHPRVAIVGKGVCFDTGGLDIKPSSAMRLMKKDMGGAAHALALAGLVMGAGLPVRLHLLIPAVENAVGSASFRPGDVLATRAGLTVENTNTDAEGRLVLGDALTRAGEGADGRGPELVLDFATLTGAARVALGPDLPPLFTDDEPLAAALLAAGQATGDPLWRLPLWDGYDDMLKSDIADMVNAPDGGFAGAITAALFLRRFAPKDAAWAHLDVFAWRPAAKPGRPKGGEAYALRAAWRVLQERYA